MNLPENRGLGNRFLFASAFQRPRTTNPTKRAVPTGSCASVFESTKPPEGKRINEQTNEWRERGFRPFSFSSLSLSLSARSSSLDRKWSSSLPEESLPFRGTFAAGAVFEIDERNEITNDYAKKSLEKRLFFRRENTYHVTNILEVTTCFSENFSFRTAFPNENRGSWDSSNTTETIGETIGRWIFEDIDEAV